MAEFIQTKGRWNRGPEWDVNPPAARGESLQRGIATEMAGGSESQSENSQVAGYFKDNRKARYPWMLT